jgi:Tfp pilus assembly protein PilF
VTARDEAAKWISDALHDWEYGGNAPAVANNGLVQLAMRIADDLPDDVLVRLTIERGALEPAATSFTERRYQGPLYRVVEP